MFNNSSTTPNSTEASPGSSSLESKCFSGLITLAILFPSLSVNIAFLVVLFKDPFKKFRTTSTEILACWFASNVVQVVPELIVKIYIVFAWSLPVFLSNYVDMIFHTYTFFLNGAFLTFTSMDNCLLVSRPLTYSTTMSKKRVRGTVGVFVFVGLCSVFICHFFNNFSFLFILTLLLISCFVLTLFAVPILQFVTVRALRRQRKQMAELDPTQRSAREVFVKCHQQLLLGLGITFIFLVLFQIFVLLFICLKTRCSNCLKVPWVEGTLSFFIEVGLYAPSLFKPLFLALRVSSYRNAFADVLRRVKDKIAWCI